MFKSCRTVSGVRFGGDGICVRNQLRVMKSEAIKCSSVRLILNAIKFYGQTLWFHRSFRPQPEMSIAFKWGSMPGDRDTMSESNNRKNYARRRKGTAESVVARLILFGYENNRPRTAVRVSRWLRWPSRNSLTRGPIGRSAGKRNQRTQSTAAAAVGSETRKDRWQYLSTGEWREEGEKTRNGHIE